MGASFISQGKLETALQLSEFSAQLLRESGRTREAALSRVQVGSIQHRLGRIETARTVFEEALETFVGLGDRRNISECRKHLKNVSTMASGMAE